MDRGALLVLLTVALAVAAGCYRPAAAADAPPSADDLFYVKVRGAGDDEATLAFQRSDFLMAGFANRTGHWFTFPDYEHLFPESSVLPFSNKISDLIRDLMEDLPEDI